MDPTADRLHQIVCQEPIPVMTLAQALHRLRQQGHTVSRDVVAGILRDPDAPLRLLSPWTGLLRPLTPPTPSASSMRDPWGGARGQRQRSRRAPIAARAPARGDWVARERVRAQVSARSEGSAPLPPVCLLVARRPGAAARGPSSPVFRAVARSVACLGYHLWSGSTRDRARWLQLYEEAWRLADGVARDDVDGAWSPAR